MLFTFRTAPALILGVQINIKSFEVYRVILVTSYITSEANDSLLISPPDIPFCLSGFPIMFSAHFVNPSWKCKNWKFIIPLHTVHSTLQHIYSLQLIKQEHNTESYCIINAAAVQNILTLQSHWSDVIPTLCQRGLYSMHHLLKWDVGYSGSS